MSLASGIYTGDVYHRRYEVVDHAGNAVQT